MPGSAAPEEEERLAASDDGATISELSPDDKESVTAKAVERSVAASFKQLHAMGFDGQQVLSALAAADGDESVAVEYLLSGNPKTVSKEIGEEAEAGDPSGAEDHKKLDGTGNGNSGHHHHHHHHDEHRELSQEERERVVLLRTRSKGFSGEEIATILLLFRQDRMAALQLELEGPSSTRTVAPRARLLTNSTLPPRASVPPSNSGFPKPDYISPFINGYLTTSPVESPSPKALPTEGSLKRPLDTLSETPTKKQKKRPCALTPPRYNGMTKEEYMKRRFGEGWDHEAP